MERSPCKKSLKTEAMSASIPPHQQICNGFIRTQRAFGNIASPQRSATAGASERYLPPACRLRPIAALVNGIVAARKPTLRSPDVQSVAVVRHGKLVLDEYFYGFNQAYPHDVRSAGKSVTGLMLGRAIEDTRAFGIDSRVLRLLPQFRDIRNDDARKQRMTVGDLITMASGLACDDNDDASPGNEDTMQSQPPGADWYKYTLDLPMTHDPGTYAVYCSASIICSAR